jgi:DnaJ-class molecular chaperone
MSKAKDPYLVLGVPRDAGITEVKRAYRRLVLALHPDRGEAHGSERLQDVQRAYETLQDTASRQAYDSAGGSSSESRSAKGSTPESPETSEPEPLTYATWRHEVRFRPEPFATRSAEIAQRARRVYSEVDELFGGVVPEVLPNRPASVHKDLFVEVVLTESEARLGGTFPLSVPVQKQCRSCLGSGMGSLTQHCSYCTGRGFLTEEKELELVVPAGVHDGQQTKVDVTTGEKPVVLRVLVRVA